MVISNEIKVFGFLKDTKKNKEAFSVVIDPVSGSIKKHTFNNEMLFSEYNPTPKRKTQDCFYDLYDNPTGGMYIIVHKNDQFLNPTFLSSTVYPGESFNGVSFGSDDKSIYKAMWYKTEGMMVLYCNKEGEFTQVPLNLNWKQSIASYEAYFGGCTANVINGNLNIVLNDNVNNKIDSPEKAIGLKRLSDGATYLLTIKPDLSMNKSALKNDLDPASPVMAQPEKTVCIGNSLYIYYTTLGKDCKFYCLKKITFN